MFSSEKDSTSPPTSWRLEWVARTTSTNDVIRRMALPSTPRDLLVVGTDFQTAGRGATGAWESAPGRNLLFTVACAPTPLPVAAQWALSEVASMAVCHALQRLVPGVSVKWPNDIYIGRGKVAGMLIEHDVSAGCLAHSFVGIGVNVNQQHFAGPAPNPVSLCQVLGRELSPRRLLVEHVMPLFACYYNRLLREVGATGTFTAASPLHRQYLAALFWADGREHPFRAGSERFMARVLSVTPRGLLVLLHDGRQRRFAFKEVAFLLQP